MIMKAHFLRVALISLFICSCAAQPPALVDCATYFGGGLRKVAGERDQRFLGKVQEDSGPLPGR